MSQPSSPLLPVSTLSLIYKLVYGNYNLLNKHLTMGVKRDLQKVDGQVLNRFGYSLGFGIDSNNFSVNPAVLYQLTNDVTLNASLSITQAGNI